MSSSFCDLARHFGALPPSTVASLTSIAEARGRAEAFRQQSPAGLETLRRVALIQSTEASNAIENIRAPRARIEALVAEKTTPENRSEQEIAGYRDVLALIHTNRADIPFQPRYVEQLPQRPLEAATPADVTPLNTPPFPLNILVKACD